MPCLNSYPVPIVEIKRAVVMTSGGLDSTVLFYWALSEGYSVTPLFLDYGQHCAATELATLQGVLPREGVRDLSIVKISDVFRSSSSRLIREANLWTDPVESADLMLPYRNLVLLVAGAAFAASQGKNYLLSAFINSNQAYEIDATASFLAGVTALIGGVGGVNLEMPFRELSKAEVVRIGLGLNAPIAATFSCQISSTEHCGACPNCVERLNAFAAARGQSYQ
jgi:7-cyano-7-deazaguanine synthase